jgi:hypothetical protein
MRAGQRKPPWWQWVLGGIVCLLIVSAIFGGEDEPSSSDATGQRASEESAAAETASEATTTTTPAQPAATAADARAAVDRGAYAQAVELASPLGTGTAGLIRNRIANRIARGALSAVQSGDRSRAKSLLARADRYPTTASTRRARVSYRAAQARVVARREQRRLAAAQRASALAAKKEAARVAAAEEDEPAGSDCDSSYTGACLDPSSSDYDCEGGSGDGPSYTGTVQVVGDDHFDLDRDGDGTGCDS